MKKSAGLLFLTIYFFCDQLNAQGNVGIDVSSPASKLDVHGAINTDSVYKIDNKVIIKAGYYGGIYIGDRAGENMPYYTTGRNTFVGWYSGRSNAPGNSNSFFGAQTGEDNQANHNSFFGSNAGREVKTGSYNCYFGSSSGSHNVTQQMNSFFGYLSGTAFSQTGQYNTISGAMSGVRSFIGDHNTLLGYDVNPVSNASIALDNSTAIGYQSRISASNQMRFGNGNITSIGGYVGWSNLSDGRFKKNVLQNVPGLAFINRLKPVTYNLDLEKLDVFYNEPDSNINNIQYRAARAAKENIVQTGLIAQDVETAAAEIGFEFSGIDAPASEKGSYSLRYAEFVVPLIKAVQELSKQNETLRQQIEDIKKRLSANIEKGK